MKGQPLCQFNLILGVNLYYGIILMRTHILSGEIKGVEHGPSL